MLLFVKRMIEEEKDLKGKINRAVDFLNTNTRISKQERGLLEKQVDCMKQYLDILQQRIALYDKE